MTAAQTRDRRTLNPVKSCAIPGRDAFLERVHDDGTPAPTASGVGALGAARGEDVARAGGIAVVLNFELTVECEEARSFSKGPLG